MTGWSRRKRRVYLVACAGVVVVCLAVLELAGWHLRTPHEPRPLFHEWLPNDRCWAFRPVLPIWDKFGAWLFCDWSANVCVLVLCGTAPEKWTPIASPTHATLLAGSPCEVSVDATTDEILVVVPSGPRASFRLDSGAARDIWTEAHASGGDQLDLATLLKQLYRGPDAGSLHALLDEQAPEQ